MNVEGIGKNLNWLKHSAWQQIYNGNDIENHLFNVDFDILHIEQKGNKLNYWKSVNSGIQDYA